MELIGRNMKKADSALFGLFLLLLLLRASSTEGDKRFCCSDGKTSITSDKVGEKLKSGMNNEYLGLCIFYATRCVTGKRTAP